MIDRAAPVQTLASNAKWVGFPMVHTGLFCVTVVHAMTGTCRTPE